LKKKRFLGLITENLWKNSLSPVINFINVLRTAFTHADPASVKKTVKFSIFFMLLGSPNIKAARKMLVKLAPVVSKEVPNLTNLHVQQTPNPLAQEPAAVPPLLVHSDLKNVVIKIVCHALCNNGFLTNF
jgi:hypothetical protein